MAPCHRRVEVEGDDPSAGRIEVGQREQRRPAPRLTHRPDHRVLGVRLAHERDALPDLRPSVARHQGMGPQHVAVLGPLPRQQPEPVTVVADVPVEDDPVEIGLVGHELVLARPHRVAHHARPSQRSGLGADRVTRVGEDVVEVRDVVGQPRRLGELRHQLRLARVLAGRDLQDVDPLPVRSGIRPGHRDVAAVVADSERAQ